MLQVPDAALAVPALARLRVHAQVAHGAVGVDVGELGVARGGQPEAAEVVAL